MHRITLPNDSHRPASTVHRRCMLRWRHRFLISVILLLLVHLWLLCVRVLLHVHWLLLVHGLDWLSDDVLSLHVIDLLLLCHFSTA